MSETIHSVIQCFSALDVRLMINKSNPMSGSFWFMTEEKCGDKIHVRITDEYTAVRLYINKHGIDTRVSYSSPDDHVIMSQIELGTRDLYEIVLKNFSKIKSEEEFFQRSLLEDMSDLEFNDISTLINFAKSVIEYAKELYK